VWKPARRAGRGGGGRGLAAPVETSSKL